jgi:U3 small nucleolar RNA-associated protein 7
MIALDSEFVGSLAPLNPVTEVSQDGRTDVPYARLPRYERLRVSGKADEMEGIEADDAMDKGEGGDEIAEKSEEVKKAKEEREKRKMRGKGKSMKRSAMLVHPTSLSFSDF